MDMFETKEARDQIRCYAADNRPDFSPTLALTYSVLTTSRKILGLNQVHLIGGMRGSEMVNFLRSRAHGSFAPKDQQKLNII